MLRVIIKLLEFMVGKLPYSCLAIGGYVLGFLYYYLAKKQRLRAYQQIIEHLSCEPKLAKEMTRRMCWHIGQMLLEVLYIPRLIAGNYEKRIKIKGADNLHKSLETGRGAILLSAHLGNWEWLGAGLSLYGFPVATLVKKQNNNELNNIINDYRIATGMDCYAIGGSEMISAAKALKKGKALGFIADQDADTHGVWTRFFNKMAATPIGPALFAERFNVDVLPTFIYRHREYHEIIIGEAMILQKSSDKDADMQYNTQLMSEKIESAIRIQPENWLWLQKRWNTKYNG